MRHFLILSLLSVTLATAFKGVGSSKDGCYFALDAFGANNSGVISTDLDFYNKHSGNFTIKNFEWCYKKYKTADRDNNARLIGVQGVAFIEGTEAGQDKNKTAMTYIPLKDDPWTKKTRMTGLAEDVFCEEAWAPVEYYGNWSLYEFSVYHTETDGVVAMSVGSVTRPDPSMFYLY